MKKLLLILFLFAINSYSQNTDLSFNPGTGFLDSNDNVGVHKTVLQPDGKILVGGFFTSFNGVPINHLARLNNDGSLDTTFNSGGSGFGYSAYSYVSQIALQSDGKIIVAGEFNTYNGISAGARIIRLNSDGTRDGTFVTNGYNMLNVSYATFRPKGVKIQSDGKSIIYGTFQVHINQINSYATSGMIRLDTDGNIDPTFSINNDGGSVSDIVLQPNGKIIAVGEFVSFGYNYSNGSGYPRRGITRIYGQCITLPPTANPQSFCNAATVANLVATGEGTKLWYSSATGGTALTSATALETGTYYVSQYTECESSTRTPASITINQPVTPTFNQLAPFCAYSSAPVLPTTSLNGITGVWFPYTVSTTTTTTYTFTPNLGQCSNNTTMTITVIPTITPTFTTIAPICSGQAVSPLPTTSNNGITGTWSPALSNTISRIYTFTPTAGQCATNNVQMAVAVFPNVVPYFSGGGGLGVGVCSGATIQPLPTTSDNGITGTWSPPLNNTATTMYTFTPNLGQCFSGNVTGTIYVYTNTNPATFDEIDPICSGAVLDPLPTMSNNGYTGTWSPPINNTTTTTYTFTPTPGQCAGGTTMTIVVNPSNPTTLTVSACNYYDWSVNSHRYYSSGTYTVVTGCSTQTLNLTISNSQNVFINESACGSYTWPENGVTYTASGAYPLVVGCTTKYLMLNITPIDSSTATTSGCGSYFWSVNGQTYTESGTYTYQYQCYIRILNLTITPSTSMPTTITACGSYTWSENGTTYTSSGVYSFTVGCITKVLNLTITPAVSSTMYATNCSSYTWSENGMTYTTSGIYTNVIGCNTKILNLTILPITTTTETVTSCGNYYWNAGGQLFTTSGTYSYQNGCNNKILNLTVNQPTFDTTDVTSCGSYTWPINGFTYTTSGSYTSFNNCVFRTLNLTITTGTTASTNITACGSYTWSANGTTYTSSGTYTAVVGCSTETLNLTITSGINNTTTISACDSYTWSVNGTTYTISGTYTAVVECHTEILNLTINPHTTIEATQLACNSYTWSVNGTTYTSSGVYTSTQGCTIQVLNLTIQQLYTYYADADGDGYGNPAASISSCLPVPIGYVTIGTDCDDTKASVHPGAIDVCLDGIDNDCNGIIDNVGLPGGCTPIVTTIAPVNCQSTVNNLAVTINANWVTGAQGYRFRIKNMSTNAVQSIDRPVNSFAFSLLPGITLATIYEVDIAVKLSNVWQPFYGTPCIITTPTPVSTIGTQCGTTLTAMNQWVYTTYVQNVSDYRFRVTNLTTNTVQVYDAVSGQNKFNFSQLSATMRAFGTTYLVEVALKNTNGVYLPYSAGCNITTPTFPTTTIRPIQCGLSTATSYATNLEAVISSVATEYKFRLSNVALSYSATVTKLINKVKLSEFSGLISGTTYTVEVSIKVDGTFGTYGATCSVTTPGLTKTIQAVSNEFKAIAYPNPFVENFMFNVKTSSESMVQIRVYDMLGKQIDNRDVEVSDIENLQVGGNYPSGVYNVIVSQGENIQTLRVIKR